MIRIRVPIHVSGLWVPKLSTNPLESGSVGAGLNIAVFLEAEASAPDERSGIFLGGREVLRGHVEFITRRNNCRSIVYAKSPFELGAGFGLSAGLSIAYSIATCRKYGLIEDCLDLAHEAEVAFRTGLGDVVAESYGGFLLRLKPGSPTRAVVRRVMVKERVTLIVCQTNDAAIDTPTMLRTIDQNNYILAENLLNDLLGEPSLERFFNYAQSFTRRLFNYSYVDEALEPVMRYIFGYYLKKRALVVWADDAWVGEILVNLNNRGFKCIESTISNSGVLVENTAKPPP